MDLRRQQEEERFERNALSLWNALKLIAATALLLLLLKAFEAY